MINREDFKRVLKAKPNCILGKNGITQEILNYIDQLLKKYKIIKIKVLKTALTLYSINELAKIISKETKAAILDVRGKTIIISKQ